MASAQTGDANLPSDLEPSNVLLPHRSFNEDGDSTIVLVHGLTSSPHEYNYVNPLLTSPQANARKSYHLLLPYLPDHGEARNIGPFSIPYAASLLAHLIKTKAKDGRAHVVGLSAGGFASIYLAKEHPSLVLSLFVTGVGGLAGRAFLTSAAPYFLIPVTALQSYAPDWAYQWVQRKIGITMPEGLRDEMWQNSKFDMVRSAYQSINRDGLAVPLQVRTLVIAGGKQDPVEPTRVYGAEVGKGNQGSQTCVVRKAIHAWDLQFPELFASGIRAWIEQTSLPMDYEMLDP